MHHNLYDNNILAQLYDCYDLGTCVINCLGFPKIEELIKQENAEIREWVAKVLAFAQDQQTAVSYLCRLAKDPETYVRVEAMDSLRAFPTSESYYMLCEATKDTDSLVRAFAFSSIGYVGAKIASEDTLQCLCNAEKTEKDDLVRAHILEGLYRLGNQDALSSIFELFQSEDYHVKCTVLRVLSEIADHDSKNRIMQFVTGLQQVDQYTLPVREALAELQQILMKTGDEVVSSE